MIRLSELLSYDHNTVFIYGQEKYFLNQKENTNENIHICDDIKECCGKSNIIISGIPLSKNNITINSPYSDESIRLDEVYQELENKTFIAGAIPIWFYENKNIENIDLLQSEELTILNAIPTVEGTIKIAIEETESTIHESNVLIFGFGRIGKILCRRFSDLGANIYCVARKEADLAWIRESRYVPVTYEEVESYANKIDLIINTVPTLVIKEKVVKELKKDCLIIDIASNPGGVDKNIAKMYKIKVITALGIPGKIAPKTAAKYIKNVIDKKIKERRYV